jgi:hypothetical protein
MISYSKREEYSTIIIHSTGTVGGDNIIQEDSNKMEYHSTERFKEQEQEQEQEQKFVNLSTRFLPDGIHNEDGENLIRLLHDCILDDCAEEIIDTAAAESEENIEGYFNGFYDCSYSFDSNVTIDPISGRIISLHLSKEGREWVNLSPYIQRLQHLQHLDLFMCEDLLSYTLQKLPALESIHFNLCSIHGFGLPRHQQVVRTTREFASYKFPTSLKKVSMHHPSLRDISSFLKLLPDRLEELVFSKLDEELDTENLFDALEKNEYEFNYNLKTIQIEQTNVFEYDETSLERLLLDIIHPKFPNLTTLDVSNNDISTFTGFGDRIKNYNNDNNSNRNNNNNATYCANINLKTLDLRSNPILAKISAAAAAAAASSSAEDPVVDENINNAVYDITNEYKNEKTALLTLLDTFRGISNLGQFVTIDPITLQPNYRYSSEIEAALRRNHKGIQKFITMGIGGGNDDVAAGSGGSATRTCVIIKKKKNKKKKKNSKDIQHELWPIIFERIYNMTSEMYSFNSTTIKEREKDKMKCSTYLFQMIRYGPFFFEQQQQKQQKQRQQQQECSSSRSRRSNTGKDENITSNNKKPPSLLRKTTKRKRRQI